MTKGWNPLLGMPPVSTYAALEELVKANEQQYGLYDGYNLRNKRWSFRHLGDGLVHNLLALHGTKYFRFGQYDDPEAGFVPVEAITECGVLALLVQEPGRPTAYDAGALVPEEPLSCLRCASGVEQEGIRYRATQKEARFAHAYGMSPERMSSLSLGSNRPNVQQIPRGPRKR